MKNSTRRKKCDSKRWWISALDVKIIQNHISLVSHSRSIVSSSINFFIEFLWIWNEFIGLIFYYFGFFCKIFYCKVMMFFWIFLKSFISSFFIYLADIYYLDSILFYAFKIFCDIIPEKLVFLKIMGLELFFSILMNFFSNTYYCC